MSESPIRVLLIEDNPGDSGLIKRLLARAKLCDFVVEHAERLEAGLKRLSPSSTDVVLVDLSLPDSNGLDTFSEVYRQAPHLPIIVLTGMKDEEKALAAVREGAQDYLLKSQLDDKLLVRSIRYAVERKCSAEALRESEERYALAVRATNDGIWDWDLKSNMVYFSPRWLSILGMEESGSSQTSETWFERVHPEDIRRLRREISRHLKGKTSSFQSEHRMRHQSGKYLWVLSRGVTLQDREGRTYRMTGSLSDITERKQLEEQLFHDALHDSLTGLPNRTLFSDRLEGSIARSQRREHYLFSVLFLDLDRFKTINDSLGHLMGDRLLKELAPRLASLVRNGDTVARLGGDEFAVLLDDFDKPKDAVVVADRILRELQGSFDLNGREVFVSASIGLAHGSSEYKRAEDLLRDSDTAMSHAKSEGGAQCAVFDGRMHTHAIATLQLENDVRKAIERKELRVYYQPIIVLNSGRIRGFEALVRWHHPEQGLLSPHTFIPIAEETGLIVPLGDYVMREACQQMAQWQQQFPTSVPLSINVNLSGKEVMQEELVERVTSILEESGLQTGSLGLEITESVIMEHPSVAEKLRSLSEFQVELHIDDFGTGYSSLSSLHQLPANSVKIDRSFVKEIDNGDGRAQIVDAIVNLAHNLGIGVAAEGLETAQELTHLQKLQCEYVQGFYFAKPLEQVAARELLANNPHFHVS